MSSNAQMLWEGWGQSHDHCLYPVFKCSSILQLFSAQHFCTYWVLLSSLWWISSKDHNYCSFLFSTQCLKLLLHPLCPQVQGTREHNSMAPSLVLEQSIPDPCCQCSSECCGYLLYPPSAISLLSLSAFHGADIAAISYLCWPCSNPFPIIPGMITPITPEALEINTAFNVWVSHRFMAVSWCLLFSICL